METRQTTGKRKYISKVRRVTACSECHRRKQKCNRQRPCAGCVARNHENRCVYDAIDSPQQLQTPRSRVLAASNHSPSIDDDDDDDNSPTVVATATAISNGIGYVDTSQTGVLLNLNLSTPSPNALRPGRRTGSGLISQENGRLAALLALVPSPSLTRKLADIFFTQANWYFSVLDRCFFDHRFRSYLLWLHSEPREDASYETYYFAALILQIIAMALQFLPEVDRLSDAVSKFTRPTPDDKSRACSDTAEAILNLLNRRQPTLSSIEADIMRCAWLKNSGYGLDAWYSLSNAVRQAQDLRLHLEPPLSTKENLTPMNLQELWHREHKCRIWACLLTWEAHMALQLGRPRLINLSDCTVRKPTNCDAPKDPTRTLLMENLSIDSLGTPSHYTSHIVKYEIALMIHRAMDTGLLRPDNGQIDDVNSMHREVETLVLDLPLAFRHPSFDTSWDIIDPDIPKLRIQIQIVVDSFLLALHRPHIFTSPDSLKAAVQAAKNVLDLSQQLFETVDANQHKTFTLVFYTIDSGIFLAVALAKLSNEQVAQDIPQEDFVETLQCAVLRLEFLEKFHTVATPGKDVLRYCLSQLETHRGEEPNSAQMPPTPSLATGSENVGLDTALMYRLDDNDDFWPNLLIDTAFTAPWLDGGLDLSLPEFEF